MDAFKRASLDPFDPLMDSPGRGMNGNPKRLKVIRRREGRRRLKARDRREQGLSDDEGQDAHHG